MSAFAWTDESIAWMRDASQKSEYYQIIAARIAARLQPKARVLDAGGGLGDLAIWLSYHIAHVTLVEREPKAVAAFRARCPQNVTALLGDVFTYTPDKPFDALVLCFFGKPEQLLPLSNELAAGKTFVVQSMDETRGFALDEANAPALSISHFTAELERTGTPYTLETFQAEHGQPLRSLADAVAFFSFYARRPVAIGEIVDRLRETDDPAFPLYAPKTRTLGLISFEPSAPRRAHIQGETGT